MEPDLHADEPRVTHAPPRQDDEPRARPLVVWRVAATVAIVTTGTGVVALGGFFLAPWAVRQLAELLNLTARAVVWIVGAVNSGLDTWSILVGMGRAVSTVLSTPVVTLVLVGLEVVGIVALFVLHRILRLDKESSQ